MATLSQYLSQPHTSNAKERVICMVGCQCDIQLWEGEGGMDAVPGVDPAIVSIVPLGFLTVTK